MYKSLISLALGTFGLGMAEFVMMGILPDIAKSMSVSIPTAGHFISLYALGVALGAIVLVFAARKQPLKKILLVLVSIHIIGNALTSIAPNYYVMLVTRFISGLPHGGFFGIGGFSISCIANYNKARVDLTLANSSKERNKQAFDYLFSHKAEIEKILGNQLEWLRSDDTKASYIMLCLEGVSIENEADWTQMAKFHAEWSKKFYDLIVPYITVDWQ